jgi:hypothetical protein
LGFKRFDLVAKRGLAEIEVARCFGEAARVYNRFKGQQLPGVEEFGRRT